MLLDDPTRAFDKEHIEILVQRLADLGQSVQIVVASQETGYISGIAAAQFRTAGLRCDRTEELGRSRTGPNWRSSTNRSMWAAARDCLARMRSESSAAMFGFKMQAVAAHILLRLNHRVVQVKP